MERKPVFELKFSYANKTGWRASSPPPKGFHFVNWFEITSSYANISVEWKKRMRQFSNNNNISQVI